MSEFIPYYTNDGSVGLYSNEDSDIYHSTYGALSEAYEKFFIPSEIINSTKESIKILDICYGIGYNSKAVLNEIIKINKKISSNSYIEQIDTDNNIVKKNKKEHTKILTYIYKIYSDNILALLKNIFYLITHKNFHYDYNFEVLSSKRIKIDAVDTNLLLLKLSPFINANLTPSNYISFLYKTHKINEFVQNNIKITKLSRLNYKKIKNTPYYISKLTNMYLAIKLIDAHYLESKNIKNDFFDNEVINLLKDKKYSYFFDRSIIDFAKKYEFWGYKYNEMENKTTFLHNIYYRYVSWRYKSLFLTLSSIPLSLNFFNDDARVILKNNNETYDVVFLDAFTPSKCPCLWSVEFFKEIYKHLSEDGIILTYSTSSAIRGAMKEAGFCIGKTFSQDNKTIIGTIASKSEEKIKYPLDEFELGLLNTKAGIPYRDNNLSLNNNEIFNNRKLELEQSNLQSTSQYKKGKKC